MSEAPENSNTQAAPVAGPVMCPSGCGFYGNPLTLNFCSKCYKDHQAKQNNNNNNSNVEVKSDSTSSAATVSSPVPSPEKESVAEASADVTMTPAPSVCPEVEMPKQKNTSRCFTCNKKIGLTGFKCHCEYFFCSSHRYPDKHECAFDFKTMGRAQLAKANPVVQASKVDKL